ncbi:MAG: hypothetical protein DRN90_06545, partial [Thermoproteota archaeon]
SFQYQPQLNLEYITKTLKISLPNVPSEFSMRALIKINIYHPMSLQEQPLIAPLTHYERC